MLKKLKEIIFVVLVIIGTITVYNVSNLNYIRWPLICGFMILAILLAELFLKEEPGELFDYFSIENWKKAKISSILMIIATIAFIATLVSVYIAIRNR